MLRSVSGAGQVMGGDGGGDMDSLWDRPESEELLGWRSIDGRGGARWVLRFARARGRRWQNGLATSWLSVESVAVAGRELAAGAGGPDEQQARPWARRLVQGGRSVVSRALLCSVREAAVASTGALGREPAVVAARERAVRTAGSKTVIERAARCLAVAARLRPCVDGHGDNQLLGAPGLTIEHVQADR